MSAISLAINHNQLNVKIWNLLMIHNQPPPLDGHRLVANSTSIRSIRRRKVRDMRGNVLTRIASDYEFESKDSAVDAIGASLSVFVVQDQLRLGVQTKTRSRRNGRERCRTDPDSEYSETLSFDSRLESSPSSPVRLGFVSWCLVLFLSVVDPHSSTSVGLRRKTFLDAPLERHRITSGPGTTTSDSYPAKHSERVITHFH